MIHQMKLTANPFSRIKSGEQVVEARLLDEKRSLVKVDDEIVFSLIGNEGGQITPKVVDLHKHKTFQDLFESFPAEQFGGKDVPELLTSVYKYYTVENEGKYGVLGIRLEYLS